MDIEALSGAATVALMTTIAFLLIAKFWSAFSRAVGSGPHFADSIMHEAAQRFREELDRLTTSQSIYLGAVLVFTILFAAAYTLQAQQLFLGYPDWQLYILLGFLLATAGFAMHVLARTVRAKRAVQFMRDANIAVGHQLRRIAGNGTRVFHDVETDIGIVDHVVVGQSGIYAVNVVARRAREGQKIRLRGNTLEFPDAEVEYPIDELSEKTARLEKELQQLLGHRIRVRSVIAAPGWEVEEQASEQHLLVNERNIAMLRGWRDNTDHLMNEDVEVLQSALTAQCLHSAPAVSG